MGPPGDPTGEGRTSRAPLRRGAQEDRIAQPSCNFLRNLAYDGAMTRRLAEVARKVGVSEATVSRVLNEKPGVSEATRQAVLTALDVLGYERPTKLRGERARLVGLVLPELQNPIFPAFAEVVGGALAQQGYTPVLCTQTAGGVTEADYIDLLLQQQVSGVVFAGGLYAQARRAARPLPPARRARKLPTVLVNARHRRPRVPAVSRATTRSPSEQAMGHLLSLGHTRIGLLLGPPRPRPVAAQAGGAPGASRAPAGIALAAERIAHSLYSLEAAQASAGRLSGARRDRHRLCQRPDGAGRDPRRPPGRA